MIWSREEWRGPGRPHEVGKECTCWATSWKQRVAEIIKSWKSYTCFSAAYLKEMIPHCNRILSYTQQQTVLQVFQYLKNKPFRRYWWKSIKLEWKENSPWLSKIVLKRRNSTNSLTHWQMLPKLSLIILATVVVILINYILKNKVANVKCQTIKTTSVSQISR